MLTYSARRYLGFCRWRGGQWASDAIKYTCTCVSFRANTLEAFKGCENCFGRGIMPIPPIELE